MELGDLQAEILGVLQRHGSATAREVLSDLGKERKLAYTTVSTVLDRLYHKGIVGRKKEFGKGGQRYLYAPKVRGWIRRAIIDRTLDRLLDAFGPAVLPAIYNRLQRISKEDSEQPVPKMSRKRGR